MLLVPSRSRILLQNLAQQGLLAPGAYALFEHAAADAGAHPAGFEIVREKRYGITSVDLLRWVGDDDGEEDCTGTDAQRQRCHDGSGERP